MVAPDRLEELSAPRPKENARGNSGRDQSAPPSNWGRGGGRGQGNNYEAYIAAHPDIIFQGCMVKNDPASHNVDISTVNIMQEKVGTIPVVCIDSNLTNYGATFKFLGDLLNVSNRTNALIAYGKQILGEVQAKVATIPDAKRLHVYYAEGADGLQTNPVGSRHTQLIELCGGKNVVGGEFKETSGTTVEVTKESLLLWNPEVVITANVNIIMQINADETWKQISAVKNHRVYLIPTKPFNWFDRPPGPNRIVGIPYLAHKFYPNIFSDSWFRKKAKEFYKLFCQMELSDADLTELITPQVSDKQ
jgi:iron complex transport system substrate-binding protein